MRTTNEYVIEWVEGDKTATVTAPEGSALSNRLIKLASECPDDVEMKHTELFHVPVKWVKVSPPRKLDLSEERKEALRESLAKARQNRTQH